MTKEIYYISNDTDVWGVESQEQANEAAEKMIEAIQAEFPEYDFEIGGGSNDAPEIKAWIDQNWVNYL